MIIPPSRLGLPVAAQARDGLELLRDVGRKQGAVGLAENTQAGFTGGDAVGHQHVIDMFAFQITDDFQFLARRDFNMVKEDQLPRRAFPARQIIIDAVIRQGEKQLAGFKVSIEIIADGIDGGGPLEFIAGVNLSMRPVQKPRRDILAGIAHHVKEQPYGYQKSDEAVSAGLQPSRGKTQSC